MKKTLVTFNIDGDVKEALDSMNINKSKLINDFLKNWVSSKTTQEIGLEIKEKELDIKNTELISLQTEVFKLNSEVNSLKKIKENNELRVLKMEEEQRIAFKTCIKCGIEIGDKEKQIKTPKNRFIHQGCFMSLMPNEWNNL